MIIGADCSHNILACLGKREVRRLSSRPLEGVSLWLEGDLLVGEAKVSLDEVVARNSPFSGVDCRLYANEGKYAIHVVVSRITQSLLYRDGLVSVKYFPPSRIVLCERGMLHRTGLGDSLVTQVRRHYDSSRKSETFK